MTAELPFLFFYLCTLFFGLIISLSISIEEGGVAETVFMFFTTSFLAILISVPVSFILWCFALIAVPLVGSGWSWALGTVIVCILTPRT